MSSRPLLQPMPVITNGNMASNITSIVTIISNLSMMSYSYKWTGSSPVGTIVIEVSNDYSVNAAGQVLNPGTWNALTLSAPTAVSGNTSTGHIEMEQVAAYAIRTRYVATSGTGTLNATYKSKVA